MNVFHRRIRDLITNVTALEDVPWADVPRWVSPAQPRPRDGGGVPSSTPSSRLTELQPDWLPLDLRMNLSLYRSRVEGGARPRQPHRPAATGGQPRRRLAPAARPGRWAAPLGLTPGYRTQLTGIPGQELGLRRVLDAYVLWQIDAGTRLRLSLRQPRADRQPRPAYCRARRCRRSTRSAAPT